RLPRRRAERAGDPQAARLAGARCGAARRRGRHRAHVSVDDSRAVGGGAGAARARRPIRARQRGSRLNYAHTSMPTATLPRTRQLTVIAEDPALRYKAGSKKGRIVTAKITVPAERLDPGPRGYRVHCIDYDSSADTYYDTAISETEDLFENA